MPLAGTPFQASYGGGGADVFYAKLSASTGALLYNTYYGGGAAEFDEHGEWLDANDNFYFAGMTQSSDLPTVNAAQSALAGRGDSFVVKMLPSGQPAISTYFGGSGDESSFGPAVDRQGNIFLSSRTSSPDFPTTVGAYQDHYGGGTGDAFLTSLSSSGTLRYSSFIGGSAQDYGRHVNVDASNRPLIVGEVVSADFPVTNGSSLHSSGSDGFLTRFKCGS
jgi:hypothetical protein